MTEKQLLKSDSDVKTAIAKVAAAIVNDFKQGIIDNFVLVGIQVHGVSLAKRLLIEIKQQCGHQAPLGTLDITMYRDDIGIRRMLPIIRETEIPFDINDCNVILVDDVLSSGRTIRAALDALNDYGRPLKIKLAALVDRGNREYPISADYCGMELRVENDEKIIVELNCDEAEDSICKAAWSNRLIANDGTLI
jgi:pyrimidine operon attenuation protein / uracil phosphoribosyltransferase